MTPFQTKHNKTSALDKARVSVALILIMALSMSIRVVAFASRSGRPTLCSSSAISQYRPRRQQQRRQCLSMSTEAMTTLEPGSHDSEMEVKKSRFIGYAKNVETWKDAQEYLEEVKSLHPKCRHACFGFVAGVNPVQERCSDDGEPTGTAGVPILGKDHPCLLMCRAIRRNERLLTQCRLPSERWYHTTVQVLSKVKGYRILFVSSFDTLVSCDCCSRCCGWCDGYQWIDLVITKR